MKREKDLCIKILQFIEKNQTSYERYLSDHIKIEDYSADQIIYHLDLLTDAELIKMDDMTTVDSNWRAVKRITSVGHDLLDADRD